MWKAHSLIHIKYLSYTADFRCTGSSKMASSKLMKVHRVVSYSPLCYSEFLFVFYLYFYFIFFLQKYSSYLLNNSNSTRGHTHIYIFHVVTTLAQLFSIYSSENLKGICQNTGKEQIITNCSSLTL